MATADCGESGQPARFSAGGSACVRGAGIGRRGFEQSPEATEFVVVIEQLQLVVVQPPTVVELSTVIPGDEDQIAASGEAAFDTLYGLSRSGLPLRSGERHNRVEFHPHAAVGEEMQRAFLAFPTAEGHARI